MSLAEQELFTLPDHLSSYPVFGGVRVTQSFVLYVCFVDRCLSFCTLFFWPLCCLFSFDIRILITPFGIFKLFLRSFKCLVCQQILLFTIFVLDSCMLCLFPLFKSKHNQNPSISECPGIMCAMYCKHGFKVDANGCDICKCKKPREYIV